jgi:hypothetical protein
VDAFLSIEKPDESELENIRKIMEMEKLWKSLLGLSRIYMRLPFYI